MEIAFEDTIRIAPDLLPDELGSWIAVETEAAGDAADALAFARWLCQHPEVCLARTVEEMEDPDTSELQMISQIHSAVAKANKLLNEALTDPAPEERCYLLTRASVKQMAAILPRVQAELERLWQLQDPRAFDQRFGREVIAVSESYGEALTAAMVRRMQAERAASG